jgi:MoxR-like ATPase
MKKESDAAKKIEPDVVKKADDDVSGMRKEIAKLVVGQENVVNALLRGIISNGHCLVEGVPGIAKTLLIRTLSKISGCSFSRIQFTVDLMPSDIIGLTAYDPNKGFYVVQGPIFSNFVIADEINRASPKTQSAMLEAMQEKQVTIGKNTFPLPKPFFVMASQNPIESLGVYPLPVAQVDRFLFKICMTYPKPEEEKIILEQNITLKNFEDYEIKKVMTPGRIIEIQEITKKVYMSKEIEDYIVKLVDATREPKKYGIELGKYIDYGGSPRMSIGLFIGAKADALMNGENFVTPQRIKDVAHDVMRHRIILNYEGEAEGIKPDDVIKEIISKVPVP